ncbi:MAG: glutamyl-tRNA reductase [Rhodospirillales bacterium]|nr:glutamyl-tRNA reductase [Rhodospirillales bacterium]
MSDTLPLPGRAFVVGANHRTSGLSLRDRLFVDDADVPAFLAKMATAGLGDAMVLSTCDRIEVQGYHSDPDSLLPILTDLFAAHGQVPAGELEDKFYLYQEVDAVRHIFSVAASMDSLVVGEPQVLGQMKAAHRLARDAVMISGPFEGLLQAAYGAAKRVRTETAIGERPVSIASAACEIARGLHGDLSQSYVAMIGAGEMGELIARQFKNTGVKGITVSHPIRARAEPLAGRLECHLTSFQDISSALSDADIIICAMGRREHSLTADMVRAALKSRRNQPQFIIDTAVPGDAEPSINRIDDAFLYELADLERVALEGQMNRQSEIDVARQLIEAEVSVYMTNHAAREAIPALSQLRAHFEAIRQTILRENPDDAARATELLVARLLHHPSRRLRERASAGRPQIDAAEQVLSDLFNLKTSDATDKNNKEDDR